MLDRLIKLYSLSGALLIFCGVLKLIIFYHFFSIDILEFLSISEIVTSFLDDINILLAFGTIMFVTTMLTFSLIQNKGRLSLDEIMKGYMEFLFPRKMKFVLFFAIVISLIITLIQLQIWRTSYAAIYFIAFCSIQMFSYLFMIRDDEGEITFSDNKIGFSTAISFVFIIYLLAQHDIERTVNNRRIVDVNMGDTVINCGNSNNIFIGKTDNYVFIKSNQSTLVIPTSEIKKYKFNRN